MNVHLAFGVTFLAAWFALDRTASSPPSPLRALLSVALAGLIVVAGQMVLWRVPLRRALPAVGLGRPVARACLLAAALGVVVFGVYVGGAALAGIDLELRANWPSVLVGALLFHGVAEELVWRGFVFGNLRRSHRFWPAVGWSVPLLMLTHVPIVLADGWLVGLPAVVSAAVTCVAMAYLWERGGRTIWAPAILHGLIGTWQLFERTYPVQFSMIVLATSILVPPVVLLFRDRFFGEPFRGDRPVGDRLVGDRFTG